MKNILFYLKKFGKLSFNESPFNPVDGLILSQISYMNLDFLLPTIDDTCDDVALIEHLTAENIKKACLDTLDKKRNRKMLLLLKDCSRYEGLKINYFSNEFKVEEVQQFCAMTFIFEKFMFIAYRGTDLTMLGWKENFNMSYMDVIPSQKEATRYFERVVNKRQLDFYLGGHSKGGNLAVCAALKCKEESLSKLLHVFNYDGPGFQTDISKTEEFIRIQSKITKMTCKEAMVGILLYHNEKMLFVKSHGVSLFQHDPYNWLVTKEGKFQLIDHPSVFSETFEKTVHDFIETASIQQRKEFLDILFQLGMEHEKTTVLDWLKRPFHYFRGVRRRYKALSQKQKQFFKKMLKRYKIIWKANFKMFYRKSRRK